MILGLSNWIDRAYHRWWWHLHVTWAAVCGLFVYLAWRVCDVWMAAAWALLAGLAVQSMVMRPIFVAFKRTVTDSLELVQRMGAATDRWAELNAATRRSLEAISAECATHSPGEERLALEIMRILSRPVGDVPS